MHFEDRYIKAVDEVLSQYAGFDLRVEGGGAGVADAGPSQYLAKHRHEYLRTVQDVCRHFEGRLSAGEPVRVLEIGAFFGAVSITLQRLGCAVTAADVPEYIDMPAQQSRYAHAGVATHSIRLEDYRIEFGDETFDAVIMCEVLEHLNFNPLPLMKEINRVLRQGGLFYLALPNMAQIRNRRRLLSGQSIGIQVQEYFDQLDPSKTLIANGHWREYTAQDLRDMLQPLGFDIKRHYFFSLGECQPVTTLRKVFGRLLYRTFPALKENQTLMATKVGRTSIRFTIPATVHRTLREL
jgi:2-polyprenyl-3-methyl-5-hydroxy-6-metoxy-1,4-benzoquinol methylase